MPDVVHVGLEAMAMKKSDALLPYSKVVINVDEENCFVAGDDSGTVLEVTNPWGTQAMADNLLAKMQGVQYQPYTVSGGWLDPSAELGDAVTTNGVYGGLYTQDSFFGHRFYADYSAPQDEQLDHEYTYQSPTERKIIRESAYTKSQFTITNSLISQEVSAREDGDSELQGQINVQAEDISAKVSQTGKNSSSTFEWSLKSDKFELKSNNKAVFTCNSSGITIDGAIKARTGYIGKDSKGFTITDSAISNGRDNPTFEAQSTDNAKNIYLGIDGIALGRKTTTVGSKTTYSNVFSVSNKGELVAQNATISGSITAKSGIIGADSDGTGGFIIKANRMYNGTASISSTDAGIFLGTTGIRVYYNSKYNFTYNSSGSLVIKGGMTSVNDTDNTTGFYIGDSGIALGGGDFKVTKGGELTAKNATITGKIYADSGYIGGDDGFTLKSSKFYSNGKSSYSSKTKGVYIGTDGIGLGENKFYVTKSGELYATNATITGSIKCTSISFSNNATLNGSDITSGTVGGTQLKDGSVSRGKTTNDVKTALGDGETAKLTVNSLMTGSIMASDIWSSAVHAKTLYVDTGAGYKQAVWRQRKDGDGVNHFYLSD